MRQILTLVFSFLLTVSLFGQDASWEWQNPKPQGSNLRDVVMLDSNTYIAVGDAGLVIKTTDDGENWDIKTLPTQSKTPINAVAFSPDKQHGVALADYGVMFVTTDQGLTWTRVTNVVTSRLRDAAFVSELDVFAVGMYGAILRSTDAGVTWKRAPLEIDDHLWGISFSNSEHGIAVAQDGIYYETFTGGDNWIRKSFSQGMSLYAADLFDDQFGIVGGNGGAYFTDDSAKTWQSQNIPFSPNVTSVIRLSKDRAYISADQYNLYGTTDGGTTWVKKLTDNRRDHLKAISFADDKHGVCVGFNGIIVRTRDGGLNWYSIFENAAEKEALRGVFCFDANTAVAVGSVIVRTTDAGKKWIRVGEPLPQVLRATHFPDKLTGYAVGDSGYMYKSTDRGTSWQRLHTPFSSDLMAVNFLNKDTGIAVGIDDNGIIAQTSDGGGSWKVSKPPIVLKLTGVAYLSPTTIVISARDNVSGPVESGTILRSTDKGNTWVLHSLYNILPHCLSFADSLHGFGGGSVTTAIAEPTLLSTTDGGITWTDTSTIEYGQGQIYGISAADRNHATTVGTNGQSFHTIDGGNKWVYVETNTRGTIYGIHHPTLQTATAVGFKSLIIRLTTNDQSSSVQYPVPSAAERLVTSIYPNPARDRTTIRLKLSSPDVLTIELFTVEGKLVRTLFTGLIADGEHLLGADLVGQASGSYIVRVTSSKKSEYYTVVIDR